MPAWREGITLTAVSHQGGERHIERQGLRAFSASSVGLPRASFEVRDVGQRESGLLRDFGEGEPELGSSGSQPLADGLRRFGHVPILLGINNFGTVSPGVLIL